MKALMIIDVQKDFCPGGALAVPDGDQVVPVINGVMNKFSLILASKDWHRPDSQHFAKWPKHCLQHTPGADFHSDLHDQKIDQVLLKGTGMADDGYSIFAATNTDPERYLRERGITELYICGLATDYCVRASALDGRLKGFDVFVMEDAIRGVEVNRGDSGRAIQEMKDKGVAFVHSSDLASWPDVRGVL